MDKSKLLAADAPVSREVTFSDGTTETLQFRQLNAGEFRRWQNAEQSDDEIVRIYAMQRLIGASLVDGKGKPVFTEKECLGLTIQGVNDLFPHVMAVAGIDGAAKKGSPSADKTGSATS